MKKIIVYTDGSCLGNPGPGGWAYLVIEEAPQDRKKIIHEAAAGELETTNNRMEMTALLEALRHQRECHPGQPVEIYSDSNLLVQTINQGWKKKANIDLWLQIDELLAQVSAKINWVKAHHLDPYNNRCDQLAFAEAEAMQKKSGRLQSPKALHTKNTTKKSTPAPHKKTGQGHPIHRPVSKTKQTTLF